jgi:hypothetical protein
LELFSLKDEMFVHQLVQGILVSRPLQQQGRGDGKHVHLV